MNPQFAASLFDSPLLLALIVIGGAIANWLAKRRQEKQAGGKVPGEAPPPPNKPSGEVSLEEVLRRLLGGEPQETPAPPPLPGTPQAQPPPIDTWMEEEARRQDREWSGEDSEEEIQAAPAARPPRIAGAGLAVARPVAGEPAAQATVSLTAISDQGHPPVARVEHRRAGRQAAFWRNPKNARRAFVASVVFAPPKGLQP
jgi:hypothetical protein